MMLAAILGAGCGVLAAPYLARLAAHVPDRADARWWRWRGDVSGTDIAASAVIASGLGALAALAAGWTAALPAAVWLALCATPLVIIDVRMHRLPDRLVAAAALGGSGLLGAAAAVRGDPHAWLRAVTAAVAVLAALIALAAPGWLGLGDAKLGAVLGGYLGWFGWAAVVAGLVAGFALGAVVAVLGCAVGRATRRTAIAFGPMLVLGALAGPVIAPPA